MSREGRSRARSRLPVLLIPLLLAACSIGPKRGRPSDQPPAVAEDEVLILEPKLRGVPQEVLPDVLRVLEGVVAREGQRAVREGEHEALRDVESRAALRGDGSPAALGEMASHLRIGRIIDGWVGQNADRFVWVLSVVDHEGVRQGVIGGSAALDDEGRWALMARSAREVLFPGKAPLEPGAAWLTERLEQRRDAWLCLGEHLLTAVVPSGRATLEIRIEDDGRASQVSVLESSLGDRSLEICLEEAGRAIRLTGTRPAKAERVRIPVVLSTGTGP
ncbi:MAG: hypothetical protein P1V51_10180 [Deltaproteobacteria bacterium]|nr:hypothetical protein [Deltaproteobacteria bacterium]